MAPLTASPPDNDDDDVVIVAAVRTPLTKSRKGGLADVAPFGMIRAVFVELLARSSPALQSDPSLIEDICVGNVLMPSNGYAAVRMAHLSAGIPETASLSLVNRQCASGLQAMANVANSIRSGTIMVGIAAGVESMSQTPMNKIRPPHIGGGDDEQVVWKTQVPPAALDCLLPMGITSDTVADRYQLKREDLDSFATESHRRALAAQQQGKFRAEMVRVGSVSMDDGIRPGTTVETLARLKPVFTPTGLTTAGNSSQTTDGAAGVLMMKRCTARKLGMSALATWKCYACVGVPPAVMGIGPAVAIPRVLSDLQLTVQDIEVFEINEAFASQAYYCVQQLGLDPLRVNPNGGAIALGHPLGATGVRLAVSIIYELRRRQKNQQQEKKIESDDRGTVTTTKGLGVVSMCVGTGMGAAAVLQVEPASAL